MDLAFFYSQWFVTLPYPQTPQTGKTIIITGSNVGLGKEAARHFTRLNAEKVILAVRSLEKGEAAKKDIEETTGRKDAVDVWQLDLSSYESVKQFVKRAEGLKRLDAVVENAAIATDKWRLEEGDEATVTVNVVSTFLLALGILPKLRESGAKYNFTPRLVIVSSEVHAWTNFAEHKEEDIFRHISAKETAKMGERYPLSKLLEVLYARELATRTKQSGKQDVIINFLNPGLCHSELARDAGWGLWFFKLILARSTEHGSRTLVSAAEAGPESHGQYLSDCKVASVSKFVTSEDGITAQKKTWEQLSRKLEKIQPGIMANV